jgi:hypothetical protein
VVQVTVADEEPTPEAATAVMMGAAVLTVVNVASGETVSAPAMSWERTA